mmetsp:Transcript_37004/g.89087  ORF Transcript_37004/g.89087 Transcript_37004/m.89087 type:complete len:249 (+) Transcript_37004:2941-3687(+)
MAPIPLLSTARLKERTISDSPPPHPILGHVLATLASAERISCSTEGQTMSNGMPSGSSTIADQTLSSGRCAESLAATAVSCRQYCSIKASTKLAKACGGVAFTKTDLLQSSSSSLLSNTNPNSRNSSSLPLGITTASMDMAQQCMMFDATSSLMSKSGTTALHGLLPRHSRSASRPAATFSKVLANSKRRSDMRNPSDGRRGQRPSNGFHVCIAMTATVSQPSLSSVKHGMRRAVSTVNLAIFPLCGG